MIEKYSRPPPDLDKARAQRRANVAQDRRAGLIADFPAARNTDPETSHAAAQQVRKSGAKAAHQQRVLDAVLRLPGLTYRELAVQCGLERHEVARRLPELERALLTRKGEERVVDGYSYTTWWPA